MYTQTKLHEIIGEAVMFAISEFEDLNSAEILDVALSHVEDSFYVNILRPRFE